MSLTLLHIHRSLHKTVEAEEASDSSVSQPEASTSGRETHGGVFIVFTDGTIALESFYTNGKPSRTLGKEGRLLQAVSCYQGTLAVLTSEGEQKQVLSIYVVEVITTQNFPSSIFSRTDHIAYFAQDVLKNGNVNVQYVHSHEGQSLSQS